MTAARKSSPRQRKWWRRRKQCSASVVVMAVVVESHVATRRQIDKTENRDRVEKRGWGYNNSRRTSPFLSGLPDADG